MLHWSNHAFRIFTFRLTIMNSFKLSWLILALSATSILASAQNDTIQEEAIFVVVEKMPEFPGGKDAMDKFFEENIVHPPRLKEEKLSGKVIVSFMVKESGKVEDAKMIQNMDDCSECGEEVLRVVNIMPPWEPAMRRGSPVSIRFNLPVTFRSGKYKRN